jgi:hypothetical protein
LLEEWARDSAADQPAVHIIGQQHSARSHELRDLLTRNGIPFEFFPAESDRGRLLLKQSGHAGSALPVVITSLLSLADGSEVRSRSVVVATGVTYRRLDAPGLAPLIGTGVYFGAAASEARAMAGRRS